MKYRILAAAVGALLLSANVGGATERNKLAIHVDQSDPAVMGLVLNNALNAKNAFAARGEEISIEIVAYGPGVEMYTANSPVKDRIAVMSLENPEIQFSACGNTLAAMTKSAGHEIELLSEAEIVPSGVVRLMELQADGYAYLRP